MGCIDTTPKRGVETYIQYVISKIALNVCQYAKFLGKMKYLKLVVAFE